MVPLPRPLSATSTKILYSSHNLCNLVPQKPMQVPTTALQFFSNNNNNYIIITNNITYTSWLTACPDKPTNLLRLRVEHQSCHRQLEYDCQKAIHMQAPKKHCQPWPKGLHEARNRHLLLLSAGSCRLASLGAAVTARKVDPAPPTSLVMTCLHWGWAAVSWTNASYFRWYVFIYTVLYFEQFSQLAFVLI